MKIDGLEVQVVRKPIKNMYLRIKPPNGVVMISAPRRMAEQTIIDFVRDRSLGLIITGVVWHLPESVR